LGYLCFQLASLFSKARQPVRFADGWCKLKFDVIKTVSRHQQTIISVDKKFRSLTGETIMPFDIASDFHAHQQTVAWCDTETGETQITTLKHNLEQVRVFYASLPPGIVGVEASSKARWFEDL